jgi:hypothetical protein
MVPIMISICQTYARYGGSAPATLGFNAVAPEWLFPYGAADAAPATPAAESTLGSHPCVALSSAQVLPEWINRNLAVHRISANGDNALTCCLTPGVHFTPAPPNCKVKGAIPKRQCFRPPTSETNLFGQLLPCS